MLTCMVSSIDGFQLMHAVFAVEQFLSNLVKRGCNFDIIFFGDLKELCVPTGLSKHAYKFQLARSILIKHLARSVPEIIDGARPQVLEFESPDDPKFLIYLQTRAVHFFLCHEGHNREELDTLRLLDLIHNLASKRKNIAIINDVEFKSSKVSWLSFVIPHRLD